MTHLLGAQWESFKAMRRSFFPNSKKSACQTLNMCLTHP